MDHIKDVVHNIISGIHQKSSPDKNRNIKDIWAEVVGAEIAGHTKPTRLKKETLYVTTDEAAWAYELSQKYKKSLIESLNKKYGEQKIKDIFFRVGEIH